MRLSDFPNSGRLVPEDARDETREIIVGNYRVIYGILEDEVQVITVRHGARLVKSEDIRR